METEQQLVIRFQNGETAAFDSLFERHRNRLFAYTLGLLRDRGLAEDTVQESFMELVKHRQEIEPRQGVAPWLYRVARNRALNLLRRRRRELGSDGGPSAAVNPNRGRIGSVPSPGVALAQREATDILSAALARLSTRDRELLLLRFHAGLTYREIAQTLGRPLGTVLWQVRRVLRKLRTMIPADTSFEADRP